MAFIHTLFAAIPFNACDNDEFKQMCEAIGQFGAGFQPPSQRDLRETLLEEEYAKVGHKNPFFDIKLICL